MIIKDITEEEIQGNKELWRFIYTNQNPNMETLEVNSLKTQNLKPKITVVKVLLTM